MLAFEILKMAVRDFNCAVESCSGKFRKFVLIAREIKLVMIVLRLTIIIIEPYPLLISRVRENWM